MKTPQSTIDRIAEYATEHTAHQPAHATTDDINLLRQEIRANSIDINNLADAVVTLLGRVSQLEGDVASVGNNLLVRNDQHADKIFTALRGVFERLEKIETNAGYFNP